MNPGSVRVSRDFFEDDAFAREPFTEREAFLWMIFEASFKARTKRIGHSVVELQRGEFAASIRFMKDAWGWASSRRVHEFLARLKKRNTIETSAGTACTVIKLCNYEKYQSKASSSEHIHEPKAEQHRNSSGTNENKGAIRGIREEEPIPLAQHLDAARENAAAHADVADEHQQILVAAGVDPAKDVTGRWFSSTEQHTARRWRDELKLSLTEILAVLRAKPPIRVSTLRYFDQAMQEAAGRKFASPLAPIVAVNGRSTPIGAFGACPERE